MIEFIKSWKDEVNRRWYLFDSDDYPYISSTSIVAIAKAYRYKDYKKDDKAKKRLKQAGTIGTEIHSVFEKYNRELLGQPWDIPDKVWFKHQELLNNYIDKVKLISLNDGPVKVIDVERRCVNPIYKYAGRFDLLVTVNGEYEIWDYKTSKQIREEDGWQLASYLLALRLEGIPVKTVRIIHIDKISKKITDLKYTHIDYMIRKFLHCIEIFKGIYFNDLLKGRINDLETFKKYKWPLKELTKDYVLSYNNNETITQGGNDMELTPVTGIGEITTKDPNKVDFNDEVVGVLLGDVPSRWVHKSGKKVFVCTGKDCERCKLGMKKTVQFKANMLTLDDTDKAVIKKIESESVRLYFGLNDAVKAMLDSDCDPSTTPIKIVRTGKGFETQYAVEPTTSKHTAFKDIAATIKDMTAFDLTFDDVEEMEFDQTANTDFVKKDK